MTPSQQNKSHFWSAGSVSCQLPCGLYSPTPSVRNGVNNYSVQSTIMDTAGPAPYFLLIDKSWTYERKLKVQHSEIKNAPKLLWCRAQKHSVTCSIYISSGILDSETQLPLLFLLLANAVTSAQLTLTLELLHPVPYCPLLIMSLVSVPHIIWFYVIEL